MNTANTTTELPTEIFDEEFETVGDHHRMAAHHFAAAAKLHLQAAAADDEGDDEATARHAYVAYRHQLNGTQYAEIAVMDSETMEDEDSAEIAAD
ncbi:hypothetical protein [Rhodoferax sp.]|uniref:hypothetical protein n=1 Tax=Rhodoferax sp. TaxID=50421 RepID=UPI0025EBA5BF|nr:hypothetical protein [Rhodoferax sp.]